MSDQKIRYVFKDRKKPVLFTSKELDAEEDKKLLTYKTSLIADDKIDDDVKKQIEKIKPLHVANDKIDDDIKKQIEKIKALPVKEQVEKIKALPVKEQVLVIKDFDAEVKVLTLKAIIQEKKKEAGLIQEIKKLVLFLDNLIPSIITATTQSLNPDTMIKIQNQAEKGKEALSLILGDSDVFDLMILQNDLNYWEGVANKENKEKAVKHENRLAGNRKSQEKNKANNPEEFNKKNRERVNNFREANK